MATKKKPSFSAVQSRSGGSLTPWLGIAFIVILLDQISKITITRTFMHGESKTITSFFNLVLAYNEGAAFSFLSTQGGWQRYLFGGIAVAAVVIIIYLLRRHAGQRMLCWALALIMGGALGNLIDRLRLPMLGWSTFGGIPLARPFLRARFLIKTTTFLV